MYSGVAFNLIKYTVFRKLSNQGYKQRHGLFFHLSKAQHTEEPRKRTEGNVFCYIIFQVAFEALKRPGWDDIALDDIGLTNGGCRENVYPEPTLVPTTPTTPLLPSKFYSQESISLLEYFKSIVEDLWLLLHSSSKQDRQWQKI